MGVSVFDKPPKISEANELARSSPRTIQFTEDTLKKRLSEQRLLDDPVYKSVLGAIDKTKQTAILTEQKRQTASAHAWVAQADPQEMSVFKPGALSDADVDAIEGINALKAEFGVDNEISEIIMLYDVDDAGKFTRGYAIDKTVIDPNNAEHQKKLETLDKIFHSWLLDQGMSADDNGVIYHKDARGELTQHVKKEDILNRIEHKEHGIKASKMSKIAPEIRLTLQWSPPEGAQLSIG